METVPQLLHCLQDKHPDPGPTQGPLQMTLTLPEENTVPVFLSLTQTVHPPWIPLYFLAL